MRKWAQLFQGSFDETINFFKRLFLRTCNFLRSGVNLINLIRFLRLYFELGGEKLFNIKRVAPVGIREVFVIRMLGDVIFLRQERAHAAKLEDALAAIQNCQLIHAGKLLAEFLVIERM